MFFCCLFFSSNAQTKTSKNAVGISIPVIFNSSDVQIGSSKIATGNAISYGINFNYSRIVASRFYGIIGMGFFKQTFGIIRSYDDQSWLAVFTKFYNYNNVHVKLGLGYYHNVGENISINGSVDFNEFYSFRQKYNQNIRSVFHKSISIGESVNFNVGINQNLEHHFSIGADAVFPFLVNWKTDKAFVNDPEIARNKLSLGVEISGKYHF